MTLIKCGQCGGKVSDYAKTCPHCSCPLETSIAKLSESNLQQPTRTPHVSAQEPADHPSASNQYPSIPRPTDSGFVGQLTPHLQRLMQSPRRAYILAAGCVLAILVVVVVGFGTAGSEGSANKPGAPGMQNPRGQNPPPSLPPEFRTLAMSLARDTKSDPKEFRDDKGIAEIIAEANSVVMDLGSIKSTDADINYIASEGRAACEQAVKRLETIDALPKPNGGKFFAESLVDVLNTNPSGVIARFTGVDPESQAIATEVEGFVALL